MRFRNAVPGAVFLAAALFTSCRSEKPQKSAEATPAPQSLPAPVTGNVSFAGAAGRIRSMDPKLSTYSSVTGTNGVITALGAGPPPPGAPSIPAGAAIYPGFIDSHSHALSFLVPKITGSDGQPFWHNLANVN